AGRVAEGGRGPARAAASTAGRGGLARRHAAEAPARLRRAPARAAAGHHRRAGRRRRAGLRVRSPAIHARAHLPHAARPRRSRLRVPGGPRGQAGSPRGPRARHPRRRRLPHERPGARDRRAASHQRRHAGDEQQLLGLREGVPAPVLRRPLHRLRHRQPALRRLRRAVRRRRILRRGRRPDRRRDERGAFVWPPGHRRGPDRSRRAPDAGGRDPPSRDLSVAVTLVHDATIVTGDDAGTIHYEAGLAVEGGRIAAIGPTPELLARYPGAERVDGRDRAVLPGLANTHTHLSRVIARGVYEDLSPPHTPPFAGGLAPLPTPELSTDEERVMVLLGALEAIRSGTTLTLEESCGIESYAEALAGTGLRLLLCERAWDRAQASIGQPGPSQWDVRLGGAGVARIAALH